MSDRVIATYLIETAHPLEKAAAAMAGEAGGRALPVPTDVSDSASVRALFAKVAESFGHLDAVFNNAGVNVPGTVFCDLTDDQWRKVVDINLTGAFFCAREAFRVMRDQRKDHYRRKRYQFRQQMEALLRQPDRFDLHGEKITGHPVPGGVGGDECAENRGGQRQDICLVNALQRKLAVEQSVDN